MSLCTGLTGWENAVGTTREGEGGEGGGKRGGGRGKGGRGGGGGGGGGEGGGGGGGGGERRELKSIYANLGVVMICVCVSVLIVFLYSSLQPTTVLLSHISVTLRKSAVYSCMTQLWHSLPAYSEGFLGTIEKGQPCDREIVAQSLSLLARVYLARLNALQDTPNSCLGKMLASYESISPAPSELALLNYTYSFSKATIDVNFREVFEKVEQNRLLTIKDCLVPMFTSVGLDVEPQLKPSRMNSSEMYVDFKLVLKEVAIFVLECVSEKDTPPTSSPVLEIPAIVLSQLSVAGCVKSNNQYASVHTSTPSLLAHTRPMHQARTNISSQFCISVDSVSTAINVPLLRCARHLIETGRLRSAWRRKRLKRTQELSQGNCVIQVERDDLGGASVERDDRSVQVMNVWEFSQSIVAMLSGAPQRRGQECSAVGPPPPPDRPLVADYMANPAIRKSHALHGSSKAVSDPVPIPLNVLSDSNNLTKAFSSTGSTSSDSSDDGASVAITMEDGQPLVPSTDPSDHDLGTSPSNAHLLGAYRAGGGPSLCNRLKGDDGTPECSNHGECPDGSSRPQDVLRMTPGVTGDSGCVAGLGDSWSVNKSLALAEKELLFSVYGLLKVSTIEFSAQVESMRIVLELLGISGAVDVRQATPPHHAPWGVTLAECRWGWVGLKVCVS